MSVAIHVKHGFSVDEPLSVVESEVVVLSGLSFGGRVAVNVREHLLDVVADVVAHSISAEVVECFRVTVLSAISVGEGDSVDPAVCDADHLDHAERERLAPLLSHARDVPVDVVVCVFHALAERVDVAFNECLIESIPLELSHRIGDVDSNHHDRGEQNGVSQFCSDAVDWPLAYWFTLNDELAKRGGLQVSDAVKREDANLVAQRDIVAVA